MAIPTVGLVTACLVWAGMVIGISFLEAPVKFRAPSLTRAVGLDVGCHVFGVFGYVEIGWTAVTAALVLGGAGGVTGSVAGIVPVWLLVAVQRLWLWPVLRARSRRIIGGEDAAPTYHHVLYIAAEAAKVLLLVGLALAVLLSA